MAKKRMFSLAVLETDAFMDLPLSAQALYFHLNLRADDDGFIGNPKRITSNIGASIDDLKLLIAKRFVIAFDDGVIVIKHWRMHNAIKKDRYTQTNFIEDLSLLGIKDNGAYTIAEHEWNTNGTQMLQSSSVDKDSIGKVSIDKDSIDYISPSSEDILFDTFWSAYPKKKGKGEAQKVFHKLKISEQTLDLILFKISEEKRSDQWNRDNGQFIPYPSTWLNQRRWEDDNSSFLRKKSPIEVAFEMGEE